MVYVERELEVTHHRVAQKSLANSAQEFDSLTSTIRTASIRDRGGSTPYGVGFSPVCTQRQNRRSAVTRKCW